MGVATVSYNGSGTFQINTSGQPVVAGTVISSTAFNALTADLATGLSTAITKDGQTTTTARIPFAAGINSSSATDSTNTSTGSIITAGGVGVAKALYVGTTANVAGAVTLQSTLGVTGVATFSAAPIYSSLTASSAVATDASKALVSVTNTGTGNNVLATSPTLVTPVLGAASATSITVDAGAVGTPSITTTGDTNTGIFFPAADTIAFSEGGAEAMRIDSAGSVGIGMTPVASYGLFQVGSSVTSGTGVSGLQAYIAGTNSALGQNGNISVVTTNAQAADIGGSIGFAGKFVAAGTTAVFAQIAGRKENSTDNNSAGYLQLATQPNGGSTTERMRITSAGDVGIGNTTPSSFDATGRNLVVGSGSGNQGMTIYAGTTGFASVNFADGTSGSAAYAGQVSYDHTNNALLFATNTGAERMRITSGGDFLLGVTSAFNSGKQCLAFSGATHQGFNIKNNADNPSDIYVGFYNAFGTNTGAIRSGGSTTSYVTSSDYRLKENVQPLVNALDKVMALNPVSYTWKTGGEDNGFIAHELQLILPNAVSGEKDAVNEDGTINPQGVDYSRLTPILTAALQEAIAEIQSLKTRVAKLEAK